MSDDVHARLAKLEAIEEIRDLKARYAQACDAGYDPDVMVSFFTDDACFVQDAAPEVEDFGGARAVGGEAIYHFFADAREKIVWALHYMIAPSIEIGDDFETATGTWYIWMPCTIEVEGGPEAIWMSGTYRDRYRKDRGTWKFSEIHITLQTSSPFAQGWVKERFKYA
jgi:hypothetical protein